ncbi:MAG: OsmC family protein [Spirochaetales bacterium]|uniref:OsmC family protein n=1 Tax=Candidatus Thalassospirochaeta sargassi TaxID=3119039 RepID=A0AAJ1MIL7_9SPIO|nr:OsmC family protein [Spirochaetales bacterium]
MADIIHTKVDFFQDEGGRAVTDSGYHVNILGGDNSVRPYELLFMSLASCLYSTFEEIFEKKRLSCELVEVDISGNKREPVPKYLEHCDVKFTVKGADKQTGFEKSFALACKYCSIYQTLSKVAEIRPVIEFID